MKKFNQTLFVAIAVITLSACGGTDNRVVDLTGLLAFLNDQVHTTRTYLDIGCDIRKDSAKYIIGHRDGLDGTPGTADDNLFNDLEEVGSVYKVGPSTLEKLYICAAASGYLFSKEAGLIAFMNDQAETTVARLDADCAIRSDSAEYLIGHRDGLDLIPGSQDDNLFDNIEEIDNVYMVGLWTINRLYACAEGFGYFTQDPGAL
ncbi:MAG: hypothetical protein JRJ19_11080 [Deltaproteobacteria bacterium]|nr:hypothetical protein [Deltaproteobacteria bacterium]